MVEEEGTPHRPRGLQRVPAAALRGPGRHDRVVPRARDRAADDQPAAPVRRRKALEAALLMARHVPARRLPPRGDDRPPAGRLSTTAARRSAARSTRRCARARTSRPSGATCSPATSTGSSRDHACCKEETKFGDDPADVFAAKSGFGGAEYLLAGLVTEGLKRGLPLSAVAALTSSNPARRFGLGSKGDLAPGFDADIALVDPDTSWTVRAGGLGVDAGVLAVPGPGDRRDRRRHVPARRAHLGRRAGGGHADRPLPAPADGLTDHRTCGVHR